VTHSRIFGVSRVEKDPMALIRAEMECFMNWLPIREKRAYNGLWC